jgi:membrane-bound lytic murein transglycosylase F
MNFNVMTAAGRVARRTSRSRRVLSVTFAATALLLCGYQKPQLARQQVGRGGELHLVTLNAPTSYYLGPHGPRGFEYRLAAAFAQRLGLRLVVHPVADVAAMRAALAHGSADLAAAQISADARWQQVGEATASYAEIPQLVVQSRGKALAHDITSLRDTHIVVRADSPQLALLQSAGARLAPDLSWTALSADQADPLELVNRGDADYAVVDANEFEFARHLYPESRVAFALPDARSVQWVVRGGATGLAMAANQFFANARASGELARIEHDADAESRAFDYQEAHQFQADIVHRLPELQTLFEEAARATGLDWRLLAAVGYQESKWQSAAVSADGAQGIMMLTTDAASAVGVNDRSNLRQNILGGARYLAQVIATIPQRIAEPDRTWLALAAYNVGYGHLEDARVLAQMHGKNPDSWDDVREELPLLAQEQWYTRVKRGYARGWEPARLVDQVRQYLAVLEWLGADRIARGREIPADSLLYPPSGALERQYNN